MTSRLRLARPATLRWLDQLGHRVHEAPFWRAQVGVLVITALHVALDAFSDHPTSDDLTFNLADLTVTLYIVPVAYAGLVYGFEGAVLTGLWSAVLVTPALVAGHHESFAVWGEELRVAIVIGTGVVMAIPVERERRERQRAEATARRLEVLNQIASPTTSTDDIERMITVALDRLRGILGPSAACVRVGHLDAEPVLLVCDGAHGGPGEPCGHPATGDDAVVIPLSAGDVPGELVVVPAPDRPLTPQDVELLIAVGGHFGLAIENALLQRQERASLESYVQLVTRAHEEERAHIARDLHDGAIQELALLCRRLDNIAVAANAPSNVPAMLDGLRAEADATLVSLRQFSRDLRPAMLDDFGLVPAIEWLLTDLSSRAELHTSLEVDGTARRLPPEKEIALFRVTQEALRNVERHAQASSAAVRATFGAREVVVTVHDDGHGFTVPTATSHLVPSGRLGLMGMHERVQLVSGRLDIDSEPGQGTRLTVAIPTEAPAPRVNGDGGGPAIATSAARPERSRTRAPGSLPAEAPASTVASASRDR